MQLVASIQWPICQTDKRRHATRLKTATGPHLVRQASPRRRSIGLSTRHRRRSSNRAGATPRGSQPGPRSGLGGGVAPARSAASAPVWWAARVAAHLYSCRCDISRSRALPTRWRARHCAPLRDDRNTADLLGRSDRGHVSPESLAPRLAPLEHPYVRVNHIYDLRSGGPTPRRACHTARTLTSSASGT
jgi:hypothetical protein